MRKKSGLFLIILGLVFLGIGVVMGAFSVRSVTEAVAMRVWDERTAVLTHCEIARHRGPKGSTTYKVIAEYKYLVEGKEYVGERVGLGSGADNIGSFHQDQYSRLSVAKMRGEPVSCWVNPDNPMKSILVREPHAPLVAFKMIFVLVFGAVGLCICASGVFTILTPDTSADDFMRHRIRMRGSQLYKSAVGVALLWNLFAVWMLYRLVDVLSLSETPYYLWGIGLSGIIPALIAFYYVLRVNKYGISYFEISPMPGVLGGPVTGNIRIPKSVQTDKGFELELQCIHQYTTRAGKNSTKHKDVLWDSHEHVRTVYNFGAEVVVPVRFYAPYDMPATSAAGGSNGHYWQLNVKASTPGIDYRAIFDVPVKRTAQSWEGYSLENMPEEAERESRQSFEQLVRGLGLGYTELGDNTIGIKFPACRAISSILFLFVFVIIWSGACWLMAGKAPALFVGVFVFFDVALLWTLLTLLFISVKLIVDKGECEIWIEKRFAAVLYEKQSISFNEIDRFEPARGMQSGSTVYYRVKANLINGKRINVGGIIKSRTCAKRLTDELNVMLSANVWAGKLEGFSHALKRLFTLAPDNVRRTCFQGTNAFGKNYAFGNTVDDYGNN